MEDSMRSATFVTVAQPLPELYLPFPEFFNATRQLGSRTVAALRSESDFIIGVTRCPVNRMIGSSHYNYFKKGSRRMVVVAAHCSS